jgi:hypothetical protein
MASGCNRLVTVAEDSTTWLAGGILVDQEMSSRYMLFFFRWLIFISTLYDSSRVIILILDSETIQ